VVSYFVSVAHAALPNKYTTVKTAIQIVRGDHFLGGNVRPTLEVTIVETAPNLRRKNRADLGIALIDI
jgi:predicted DNA-binding protein with PD1-like motif